MYKTAVNKTRERRLINEIITKVNVEILLNRLEISDTEKVQILERKLATLKSGIIGEERLIKIIEHDQYPFPKQILRTVSLDAGGKFQTDCLILTPNVIFLFESKNISGKLSFEKNPERLVSEKETGQVAVYESPEVQVERNVTLLRWWLEERGLRMPVVGAFVLTSASHPIILNGPHRIPALFPKTIFSFINSNWHRYREKTKYLSLTELERLSVLILDESVKNRYKQFPLRESLQLGNLINGVRCNRCSRIGMKRHYGCWECPSCGNKDKESHIFSLQEWFLFNKDTITNKECRDYLMIDDRHRAKRFLKHEKILEFGNHKGTYYKWNW